MPSSLIGIQETEFGKMENTSALEACLEWNVNATRMVFVHVYAMHIKKKLVYW